MAEDEQSATMITNPSPKKAPLCEECRKNPSKYKCPGCSIRTCCLSCVKAHKERTACNGKKQYKDVVPLSQFNDNLLLSDYNMLEDVKRVAESGRRMRFKTSSRYRLPFPLKSLRSAAASRRTKLTFFSSGMSKREKNRTYYNYRELASLSGSKEQELSSASHIALNYFHYSIVQNNSAARKKYISWTIEWRFHSIDVVIIDHGVHENRSLVSVIENHLRPGPWKHQLRQFCEQPLDSLKFFIRKHPKGPRSPFRELNLKGSIREQLANLVILEYPVIHVFLPSHRYDFEVIKDATPCRVEDRDKESIKRDELCETGIKFKEEVVEDGSVDPRVSDLMNTQNADEEFKSYTKETIVDKRLNDGFNSKLLARSIQCSTSEFIIDTREHKLDDSDTCIGQECKVDDGEPYIGHKSEEIGICGSEDFDLDQSLIDAYRNAITQTNSVEDSFLEFDGILPEVVLEEHKGHAGFNEELEEGEIV